MSECSSLMDFLYHFQHMSIWEDTSYGKSLLSALAKVYKTESRTQVKSSVLTGD